jgi:transposase-like protein
MSNTTNPGERGRFSAPRKAATVLRLLRGERLELLARELGVTAATLAGWRDDFLAGGQAALKSRPADDRDEEVASETCPARRSTSSDFSGRSPSSSGRNPRGAVPSAPARTRN